MKKIKSLADFLLALYNAWISERPGQMAAGITYYGLFSLAPLIFIGYTLVNLVFKQETVFKILYTQLVQTFGTDAANLIQDAVLSLSQKTFGGSFLVSTVSFLALLFAASGMFFQIQFSLNTIFKAPRASRNQTWVFILQKLLSFLMVVGIGFLAILASFLNIVLTWVGSLIGDLAGSWLAVAVLDRITFFGLIVLAFALIYRFLPEVHYSWLDVTVGAALATLLSLIASWLIGFYFSFAGVGSAFEAAGAFAVILISGNIFAQIFLFGALVTREFAQRYGSRRKKVDKAVV